MKGEMDRERDIIKYFCDCSEFLVKKKKIKIFTDCSLSQGGRDSEWKGFH